MKQDFDILDINGESVPKVCVQFMYKGLLISASKIFHNPIVAFDKDDNIVAQGHTVEDVIDTINQL